MSRRTNQLMKENSSLIGQLSAGNREILMNIVMYLRSANISAYQQELLRRDIAQMILDGQRRGEAVEEVIGEDYRLFCDSVLGEVPRRSGGDRVVAFVSQWCFCLALIAPIWAVFKMSGYATGESVWPYLLVKQGDLVTAVMFVVVVTMISTVTARNALAGGVSAVWRGKRFLALLVVVTFVGTLTGAFLNRALFRVHMGVVLCVMLIAFACYRFLDERVDGGEI